SGCTRQPLFSAAVSSDAASTAPAPAAAVCAIVFAPALPITSPASVTPPGITESTPEPFAVMLVPSTFTAPNTIVDAIGNCADGKIGRATCRERVEITAVPASLKQ